jgi:hypothetical protein
MHSTATWSGQRHARWRGTAAAAAPRRAPPPRADRTSPRMASAAVGQKAHHLHEPARDHRHREWPPHRARNSAAPALERRAGGSPERELLELPRRSIPRKQRQVASQHGLHASTRGGPSRFSVSGHGDSRGPSLRGRAPRYQELSDLCGRRAGAAHGSFELRRRAGRARLFSRWMCWWRSRSSDAEALVERAERAARVPRRGA